MSNIERFARLFFHVIYKNFAKIHPLVRLPTNRPTYLRNLHEIRNDNYKAQIVIGHCEDGLFVGHVAHDAGHICVSGAFTGHMPPMPGHQFIALTVRVWADKGGLPRFWAGDFSSVGRSGSSLSFSVSSGLISGAWVCRQSPAFQVRGRLAFPA